MPILFERKTGAVAGIPTISLPDIVFLLLIFFMVSAVFKEYQGLPVNLPTAKQIEKIPGKRDVAYVWMDRNGRISIDDKIVTLTDLAAIIQAKRNDPMHPLKLTSLKLDEHLKMEQVYRIQETLRAAEALNINYSAKPNP
jgi:biopolymer transport protein ExbD